MSIKEYKKERPMSEYVLLSFKWCALLPEATYSVTLKSKNLPRFYEPGLCRSYVLCSHSAFTLSKVTN